jgi:hypothetical protein
VTRSISGHLTWQMQEHYSTVNAQERRQSIGKVIELMKVARQRGKGCSNEKGRLAEFANRLICLRFLVGTAGFGPATSTV